MSLDIRISEYPNTRISELDIWIYLWLLVRSQGLSVAVEFRPSVMKPTQLTAQPCPAKVLRLGPGGDADLAVAGDSTIGL